MKQITDLQQQGGSYINYLLARNESLRKQNNVLMIGIVAINALLVAEYILFH